MKKLLTLIAFVLMTMTANAQAPQILGESHAIQRIGVTSKYLLLPVQEKEEIANIRIIVNNEQRQTFNVKLAVDKVDYFVPVDIKRFGSNNVLLDINFHGDRRTKGAIKDFACWKEMKQSNGFDTANRERFRPLYHHTPVYGWMNDPNGMFYKDGVYHLYYQWNPYGSQWENMTWGHSTSRDLIHWEAQPTAIEPDAIGTIFSGSCVVDKKNDRVVAFYTSAGQNQVQSMAVSKDNGITFQKEASNPILTSNEPDFRDPKAFWNPEIQKWNLVLAVGQEMRIYSSPNLKDWTYESSFGKGYGNHDGVWECPDLMKLQVRGTDKQKWMLICNINPGGPFGGSATQYFVGDFDGKKFTCEHKDTRWMDYGKDHYATVTFDNAPDGRKIALAWMSNWQYANSVPTMQYRSANSVPRDLNLFEYQGETYCSVTPSKELLSARGKKVKKLSETCEVVIDMKAKTEIVLSNTKGEQVIMSYDGKNGTFSMDRSKSGNVSFSEAFPVVTVAPTYGDIHQLRIFIDRCSIEAIDADGKMAMTNLVFPSEPYNNIKVKSGKATIYEIK
ncbi:MAG: DUF4980 domain-containing protein [Prevotella sp.]|nr:DUF4980 domain-containing protein [Prevotella sp.]